MFILGNYEFVLISKYEHFVTCAISRSGHFLQYKEYLTSNFVFILGL